MNRTLLAGSCLLLGVVAVQGCTPEGDTSDDRLPHPTEMDLAAPSFERPDPTRLRTILDNGLATYVVEDDVVPLVTVGAVIGAGWAHDTRQGSAEVLAQVLRARGPGTRSGGDFRSALERMVAQLAVTQTPEETSIELNVPREDWAEALALLADLVRTPALSDADVRAAASRVPSRQPGETGAYDGSLATAVERMTEHVFRDHPFGEAPSPLALRTLNGAAVQAYHRAHYVPANVVVWVAGAVETDEARAALEQAFADWEPAPLPEEVDVPAISADDDRELIVFPVDKLQAWLVLGHALPPVPLEDEAPLQVMNYVLGGGHFDTRLFRATRDRRGLTNDDSGFLEPGFRGPGVYTFRTYGRPDVLHLLLHLTLQEIDRIRAEPVTEEELFVAKGALADGEYTLGFRDGPATAATLAREWLRHGDHARSGSYQDRIRSVTVEDVLDVAVRYLSPERMDAVLVGPWEEVSAAEPIEGEPTVQSFGRVLVR